MCIALQATPLHSAHSNHTIHVAIEVMCNSVPTLKSAALCTSNAQQSDTVNRQAADTQRGLHHSTATMAQPISSSWPSCRPSGLASCDDDSNEQLSHEQLLSWVECLTKEQAGNLVIPADSLLLLPAQLPYELLGPCILAAVDAAGSAQQPTSTAQRVPQGLQLQGIDLQEPITGPLSTCLSAYTFLQHLGLQELNVDAQAAAAVARLLQRSPCSLQIAAGSSSSNLISLSMQGVFMCQLAWQALSKGIAANCSLRVLRLQDSLTTHSLNMLAAAIPAGCHSLQQLDVSCNTLGTATHSSSSSSGSSGGNSQHDGNTQQAADQAWCRLLEALAQPCCNELQVLLLNKCSVGPVAAAALTKLLRAKARCNLQQLKLAGCAGMTEEGLRQVMVAAGSHPSMQVLDVSCTNMTDACLRALTECGSSWHWQQRTCEQLRVLVLSGNNRLTGAAVAQLAKLRSAAGLKALRTLDLANCPGVGDTGAVALAACIAAPRCVLEVLNLSGCEVTDVGAAALAAAVSGPSGGLDGSSGRSKARSAGTCSGSSLRELRLADNQITATGIQSFIKAVQSPHCRLRLLDVSFNMVGPKGILPLVNAAAAASTDAAATTPAAAGASSMRDTTHNEPQQHLQLKVLHECTHDMWRVEAAKAAARAVAAADAAAAAAAEAAAAAAAAGSSWDPHGSDTLSVEQHPAAATALGFANSSYEGGCSMRTHAGSPVPTLGLSPLGRRHLWPQGSRNKGSAGVHDVNARHCAPGSHDGSSGRSQAGSISSLATVDPHLLAGSSRGKGSSRGAGSSKGAHSSTVLDVDGAAISARLDDAADLCGPAAVAAAGTAERTTSSQLTAADDHTAYQSAPTVAAADAEGEDLDSASWQGALSIASSSSGGIMQQEVSFADACRQQVADDVLHSPTRYDQMQQQQQEQQQQQLKGLLGSQEFTLSPPNPLFFSHTPLTSPVAVRQMQAGVGHTQGTHKARPTKLQLEPQLPGSQAEAQVCTTAAAAAQHGGLGGIAAPAAGQQSTTALAVTAASAAAPSGLAAHGDGLQPAAATAAPAGAGAGRSNGRRAVGAGLPAVMQLRLQPYSPDRQLAAPTIRALPPSFSPRRRCGVFNTPSPAPAAAGCASAPPALVATAPSNTACMPSQFAAASSGPAAAAGTGCGMRQAAPWGAFVVGAINNELRGSRGSPAGSIGSSTGSCRSPMQGGGSTPNSARCRVTAASPALVPVVSKAADGQVGSRARSKAGHHQQQQQQVAARQLFQQQQKQQCELKAVASSVSYWQLSMCDVGCDELERCDLLGAVAACGTQGSALPLVCE